MKMKNTTTRPPPRLYQLIHERQILVLHPPRKGHTHIFHHDLLLHFWHLSRWNLQPKCSHSESILKSIGQNQITSQSGRGQSTAALKYLPKCFHVLQFRDLWTKCLYSWGSVHETWPHLEGECAVHRGALQKMGMTENITERQELSRTKKGLIDIVTCSTAC